MTKFVFLSKEVYFYLPSWHHNNTIDTIIVDICIRIVRIISVYIDIIQVVVVIIYVVVDVDYQSYHSSNKIDEIKCIRSS